MRLAFIALLAAAIAVWLWVGIQFFHHWAGGSQASTQAMGKGMPSHAVRLLHKGQNEVLLRRDPFQSLLYAEKPEPPKAALPTATRLIVVSPPAMTVDGILMGNPPMAILKRDGQTELAKEGQILGDVTVIRIEPNQVTVRKQGRSFSLPYPPDP